MTRAIRKPTNKQLTLLRYQCTLGVCVCALTRPNTFLIKKFIDSLGNSISSVNLRASIPFGPVNRTTMKKTICMNSHDNFRAADNASIRAQMTPDMFNEYLLGTRHPTQK